jgi:superfamily II DNA or RNA helicase
MSCLTCLCVNWISLKSHFFNELEDEAARWIVLKVGMKSLMMLIKLGSRILFIAPPAWGKTRGLLELKREMSDYTFVFVSPLRALCDEFAHSRCRENILWIKGPKDWDHTKKYSWIITTIDQLGIKHIEQLESKKVLYILDEFHLYYMWESFRSGMLYRYQELVLSAKPILFLTATMPAELLERWEDEMKLNSEHFCALDLGNMRLKNNPKQVTYYPLYLKWLYIVQIKKLINQCGTHLIFCKYRNEVDEWLSYFRSKNICALGCKGGEASAFTQELLLCPNPKVIIATTVLSHGVNLPSLKNIIITYPVLDDSFLIQMVGRGGRKGETYRCFLMDKKRLSIRVLFQLILYIVFKPFSTILELWQDSPMSKGYTK